MKKMNRGENLVKKRVQSLTELIRKNREAILKDVAKLEKIEKQMDEKYSNSK
ncbi:FbpB family small basic protein [Peribacillus sp. NPDC096379]|uniref:FbpB family small basic protein n=1 Tax=Peribacillus sp. NPDC096379 TaxID=3364393 RepID=UPI00380DA7AA